MAEMPAPGDVEATGILYFDPNPTTARLATAGLRLAGYTVYNAASQDQAVQLCREHGPGGDGSIAALLLDSATSPAVSAAVLRALVQVPRAAELPGILLVSRADPTPIPGAEGLPALKRPFTIPALLKVVREAIDAAPAPAVANDTTTDGLRLRLHAVLSETVPGHWSAELVASLAAALVREAELPTPASAVTLLADLARTKLESILEMLEHDGARGVLTVERDDGHWGRLHIEDGSILLAEVRDVDEDLRLGRFVVEGGLASAPQVEAVANTPDAARRPLGERLVEAGVVRMEDLARVLLHQSREVTCELLRWHSGRATFSPAEGQHPLAAAASQLGARLRIAEALLDGLRRLHEAAEMGPHMAAIDDVYVRLDPEIGKLGRHAFARDELDVLELLNGRHSVKDIARKTRTGTFAVAKIIYRLVRANLARRRELPALV